jgi:DNA-binding CsgD family transcriptional regulator
MSAMPAPEPDGSEPGTTTVRGRDDEIAVIARGLDVAVDGQGGIVLVDGPPGIGKTRILSEAASMARRRGMRVLAGEGYDAQETVPFAPLLAAVLRAEPPIADISTIRRLESGSDLRYWAVHDLQAVLEETAAGTPLLVLLDDLQWADAGSLVALRSLTASLAHVGVLWLLALRTGETRPVVRTMVRRLVGTGAHRISLKPVTADAASAIVDDIVGAPAAPDLAAVVRGAGGNPFLLVDAIHGLRAEDRLRIVDGKATVRGTGPPGRLAASMQERLDLLAEDTRHLVRVAAVLPRRFTAAQLAAMVERSPSAILDAVDRAIDADLLVSDGDALGFRHDLVRDAVRDLVPASMRRALERDASTILLAHGASPAVVAALLVRSAERGDLAAVRTLRQAARILAPADADIGAELSLHALRLLPEGSVDRSQIASESVVLLNLAGRTVEARRLADEALTTALGTEQEATVRLSLARMLTRPGADRAAENRRALGLPHLSPGLRAAHQVWFSYNLMMSGDAVEARSAADAALGTPEVLVDPQLRAIALLTLALVHSCDGEGRAATDRLEELLALWAGVTGTQLGSVEIQHPNLLAVLGRVEEGRRVVAATIARAQRERNGAVLAILTQDAALIDIAGGRLTDARAEADSVDDLMEEVGGGNLTGWIRMLALSQLAQHTGERRLAHAAVDAATILSTDPSPMTRRWAARVRAIDAEQTGQPHAAARHLADDPLTTITPPVPNELDFLVAAARIASAADDADLADRVLAAADRLGAEQPGLPLFHAVSLHLRGIIEHDSSRLERAADALARLERPLLAAAAAEDAGAQLLLDGEHATGIRRLDEAAGSYEDCDATADADRVARRLRREGKDRRPASRARPTTGWGSLTASEVAVVRLIASGATNRDAAATLFVSPHTVSSHLRSAFRKLGVNSRVQLANVVHLEDS